MGGNWHISRNGQQYGPYTFELLQNMARSNQVLPTDMVWSETTGVWVKASEVEGLFASVSSGDSRGKEKKGRYVRNPNQRKRPFRKVLIIAAAVVVVLAVLLSNLPDNTPLDEEMKKLDVDTYFAVKYYELAGLQTARVLNSRPDQVSYETWKAGLDEAMALWEEADKSVKEMEATADRVIKKAAKEEKTAALFRLGPKPVYAYTSEEIVAMYDAGPKGQKLKNLAKQLGVSARRALAELKTANSQIEAKSWNDLEKVAQTCENRLTAIKDASKVTVYTGGLILSGGATSAFQAAGMVVNGADIVLEVGSDISAIAFGDAETATLLNDIRTLTEPAASIMGLADLAKLGQNLSKLSQYKDIFNNIDKVDNLKSAQILKDIFAKKIDLTKLDIGNTLVYIGDQWNSYTNPITDKDRKILGLNIATTKERIQEIRDGKVKPELKIMTVAEAQKAGLPTAPTGGTVKLALTEPQSGQVAAAATSQTPPQNTPQAPQQKSSAPAGQTQTPPSASAPAGKTGEAEFKEMIAGTWKAVGSIETGGTTAIGLFKLTYKTSPANMTMVFDSDGNCSISKTLGGQTQTKKAAYTFEGVVSHGNQSWTDGDKKVSGSLTSINFRVQEEGSPYKMLYFLHNGKYMEVGGSLFMK